MEWYYNAINVKEGYGVILIQIQAQKVLECPIQSQFT